jgi:hypothetical protein
MLLILVIRLIINGFNIVILISYKGARIINFYGELFGIDYALPKMDMCVQPSMGGAMENWGLGNLTSLLSYKELL